MELEKWVAPPLSQAQKNAMIYLYNQRGTRRFIDYIGKKPLGIRTLKVLEHKSYVIINDKEVMLTDKGAILAGRLHLEKVYNL